jgi:hypothetical protein
MSRGLRPDVLLARYSGVTTAYLDVIINWKALLKY